MASGMESFNYMINITVPDSLVVANGGMLIDHVSENGQTTYSYQNIKPAWRIDIPIAKYEIITDDHLKVYYLPDDSVGAKNILHTSQMTFELYTLWWGELDGYKGFSIIEIPDNWGSQTDVTCIIQTAAAFKSEDRNVELYHEISHLWNVPSKDKYPPRWNEGLAMFIQFLTNEKLDGNDILNEKTDRYINEIESTGKYHDVPLIDYGKENVTGLSYRMGMVMFNVLYNLVGEEAFHDLIGIFYHKFNLAGATTEEFIITANEVTVIDLDRFFNDWIYTTNFATLIESGYTLQDFVNHYKE